MASRLSDSELDLASLLAETETPEAGALVVFGGTVRIENAGKSVSGMDYSAYAPLAEKALAEIERECQGKFAVLRCRVMHRIGALKLGELSVLVIVRAAHREEAFAAARWAIDTLKQHVPIWKKEHYGEHDSAFLAGTELKPASEVQR